MAKLIPRRAALRCLPTPSATFFAVGFWLATLVAPTNGQTTNRRTPSSSPPPQSNAVRPHAGTRPAQPVRTAAGPVQNPSRQATVPRDNRTAGGANGQPQISERLNLILNHWEEQSGKIKTYSSRFVRWEYNAFGPGKDAKGNPYPTAKAEGVIRYAAPDKGEFKIERIAQFDAKSYQPGKAPSYDMKSVFGVEHWICDGKSVFELDNTKKQLIERPIPPELQGSRITDGPLPFMFGAKKEKLLARYHIQEIYPKNKAPDQYWLEVRPRYADDAKNFQILVIVLDKQMFLPIAMQVYEPSHSQDNVAKKAYQFLHRKRNDILQRTAEFLGGFVAPRVPSGWQKVVERDTPVGPTPPPAAATRRPPTSPARTARKK